MAIAVVATSSTAFGSSGGTTPARNILGSNLIIVGMSYTRPTTPTLSDNSGNTYTPLTKYEDSASNGSVMVWYCSNPSVTSSHTLTTNCRLGVTSLISVSGARVATSPFDQVVGTVSGSSPTIPSPFYTTPITPSADGCIVVTVVMQNAGVGAPTVPTGYTLVGSFAVGTSFPGGCAYKIQTTAATEDPGWGINTSANVEATAADFFVPAVINTNTHQFFMFFGN